MRKKRGKTSRSVKIPKSAPPKQQRGSQSQIAPTSNAHILPASSRLPMEILSKIFMIYKDMYIAAISPPERDFWYDVNTRPNDKLPRSQSVYVEGQGALIHPQLLFTQVSSTWRAAALGTAGLWNSISWSPSWPNILKYYTFVRGLIEQEKDLPLDMEIFPSDQNTQAERLLIEDHHMTNGGAAVLELISFVFHRWRRLRVRLPMSTIYSMLRLGVGVGKHRTPKPTLPQLEYLHLHLIGSLRLHEEVHIFANAPLLTEVCISADFCKPFSPYPAPFDSYNHLRLPWAQLTRLELPDELAPDPEGLREVFRACQRLEMAVFFVPDLDDGALAELALTSTVTLSNLNSLQLRFFHPNAVPFLLDSVKLPQLERLELYQDNGEPFETLVTGQALLGLIERAWFPLKILKLYNVDGMHPDQMIQLLGRLDELNELYIHDLCHRFSYWQNFLPVLLYKAGRGDNILPKLKFLMLHASFICCESADQLLEVVISRWNPMGIKIRKKGLKRKAKTQLIRSTQDGMDEEYHSPETPKIGREGNSTYSLEGAELDVYGGVICSETIDKLRQCEDEGLKLLFRKYEYST